MAMEGFSSEDEHRLYLDRARTMCPEMDGAELDQMAIALAASERSHAQHEQEEEDMRAAKALSRGAEPEQIAVALAASEQSHARHEQEEEDMRAALEVLSCADPGENSIVFENDELRPLDEFDDTATVAESQIERVARELCNLCYVQPDVTSMTHDACQIIRREASSRQVTEPERDALDQVWRAMGVPKHAAQRAIPRQAWTSLQADLMPCWK